MREKYEQLKKILTEAGSVLVAFSGGVDSTLLLKVAVDVLGERAIAVTESSPLSPPGELSEARRLAAGIGARHIVLELDQLTLQEFVRNPPDRCYLCKLELMNGCRNIAKQEGIPTIIEGSNLDDLSDYRPGRKALEELAIRSPLLEAGLSKAEIRELSRMLALPTWDKPSLACLASRFPYGTDITRQRLEMVSRCEEYLKDKGFRVFRVRYHDDIVRVELAPEEFPLAMDVALRSELVQTFKAVGFRYITLDLEGYRTGSMN